MKRYSEVSPADRADVLQRLAYAAALGLREHGWVGARMRKAVEAALGPCTFERVGDTGVRIRGRYPRDDGTYAEMIVEF